MSKVFFLYLALPRTHVGLQEKERDLSDVVWAPREPGGATKTTETSVGSWLARAADMRWWTGAVPNSTVCKWPCSLVYKLKGGGWEGLLKGLCPKF